MVIVFVEINLLRIAFFRDSRPAIVVELEECRKSVLCTESSRVLILAYFIAVFDVSEFYQTLVSLGELFSAKSEENPTFIRVGMLILDRLVAVDSLGVQHYNTPVVITPIPIVSEFAPRGLDRLNIFLFHICCVDYYSSILSSMSVKQDFGGRRLNFPHALRRASAAVLALTV